MTPRLTGIHHVTAIAGDPQRNLDFYTNLLGMRLVKLTVNFDDPGTYHFYFGDAQGNPGSILTFFPWANARQGRAGNGQVTAIALAVAASSLGWWTERVRAANLTVADHGERFGEKYIAFADPDGIRLEIFGVENDERLGWEEAGIDAHHAIKGVHSVTLSEAQGDRTAKLLIKTMGVTHTGEEGNRTRFVFGDGGSGAIIDVLVQPGGVQGTGGIGTVHHVAWRTPDDDQQRQWRDLLDGEGYGVSPIMDRNYFHSIYYREPGGVLFEIATDPPGFTTDELPETLGTTLKLPEQYEPHRAEIERTIAPLILPSQK